MRDLDMLTEDTMSSMGGRARAEALSAEERAEIAKKAAEARWSLPKATHEGSIPLASKEIPCAVLEGGTRLLTQGGFLLALGRAEKAKGGQGSTVDGMIPFLAAENVKPFITNELAESTTPIRFRTLSGAAAFGYKAEILPMVCEVYLDARAAGKLHPSQERIAKAADLILRGLARVGIAALIDEATGYADVRDRIALAKILEKYLMTEARKWERMFQIDYYRELFRLQGWTFNPDTTARTPYLGKLTNDIIYDRLQPGILKKLNELNPRIETSPGKKRRKHRFFQFFTGDVGVPELKEHLSNVTVLMKVANDWNHFIDMLDKVKPRRGDTLKLDLDYSSTTR